MFFFFSQMNILPSSWSQMNMLFEVTGYLSQNLLAWWAASAIIVP